MEYVKSDGKVGCFRDWMLRGLGPFRHNTCVSLLIFGGPEGPWRFSGMIMVLDNGALL